VSPPKVMYRMSTISPPTEPESCSSPNCKHGKPNASEHEQHTLHMYQNYMINQFSPSIHPSLPHPPPLPKFHSSSLTPSLPPTPGAKANHTCIHLQKESHGVDHVE
jgi:hypothetical protein